MRAHRSFPFAVAITVIAIIAVLPLESAARAPCASDSARDVAKALAVELETECPCDSNWRNHGEYVRCVAYTAATLYRASEVPRACARRAVACAARSTCGRSVDAVRCCATLERQCVVSPASSSPVTGRCEGSGRACDSNEDCVVTRCRVAADAAACRELRGGSPAPAGSCCDAVCPALD